MRNPAATDMFGETADLVLIGALGFGALWLIQKQLSGGIISIPNPLSGLGEWADSQRSTTVVGEINQFHDDGLCWSDVKFNDGHWEFHGPIDASNCIDNPNCLGDC